MDVATRDSRRGFVLRSISVLLSHVACVAILWMAVSFIFPFGVARTAQGQGKNSGVEFNRRRPCACTCWDRRESAGYERKTLISKAYSVYMNMFPETSWLLLLVLCYAHLTMSFLQRLTSYALRELLWRFGLEERVKGGVSISLLLGMLATVYPNFYSFWATWNYINKRWYSFWYSQLFFTVTELVVAVVFVLFGLDHTTVPNGESIPGLRELGPEMDRPNFDEANANGDVENVQLSQRVLRVPIVDRMWFCSRMHCLRLVVGIAGVHLYLALSAQGFAHLFGGQGAPGLSDRDALFAAGDVIVMLVAIMNLRRDHCPTATAGVSVQVCGWRTSWRSHFVSILIFVAALMTAFNFLCWDKAYNGYQ